MANSVPPVAMVYSTSPSSIADAAELGFASAWLRKGLLTHTLANLVGEQLPPLVAAFVAPAESLWLEAGGADTDDYVRMLSPPVARAARVTSRT